MISTRRVVTVGEAVACLNDWRVSVGDVFVIAEVPGEYVVSLAPGSSGQREFQPALPCVARRAEDRPPPVEAGGYRIESTHEVAGSMPVLIHLTDEISELRRAINSKDAELKALRARREADEESVAKAGRLNMCAWSVLFVAEHFAALLKDLGHEPNTMPYVESMHTLRELMYGRNPYDKEVTD